MRVFQALMPVSLASEEWSTLMLYLLNLLVAIVLILVCTCLFAFVSLVYFSLGSKLLAILESS